MRSSVTIAAMLQLAMRSQGVVISWAWCCHTGYVTLVLYLIAHSDSSAKATLANPELEEARPHSAGEEELQLQLALAMSKEEADSYAKKKTNDDLKLQLALEESKKDDSVSDEVLHPYPHLSSNDYWGNDWTAVGRLGSPYFIASVRVDVVKVCSG